MIRLTLPGNVLYNYYQYRTNKGGMMGKTITINIVPIGKPRMTQRDRWKKRPCVLRYHAFCDELRAQVGHVPINVFGVSWVAYLPMPASWSKKKRFMMSGTLHRQRPDRDNIDKAILDALFKDDSGVAFGSMEKRWDDGDGPRIELVIMGE